MLRLKVIDDKTQHFVLSFDTPGRVEVSVINGRIIAHAYHGIKIDMEQDTVFAFDGTLDKNVNCESSPDDCPDDARPR